MKPFYKNDKAGRIDVRSFDVAVQGVYLTISFLEGYPFDMAMTQSYEQAELQHKEFVDAAVLVSKTEPMLRDLADRARQERRAINKDELDMVLDTMMPIDRSLLN